MDEILKNPETMKSLKKLMSNPNMKDIFSNLSNSSENSSTNSSVNSSTNSSENGMSDFSQLMSNPNILKMASQFMSGMSNMPNMPNNPNIPNMSNMPDISDMSDISEPKIELETKYKKNDIILINNLKNKEYNNKTGKILFFNQNNNRYIIELDNDKKISVKEDNCFEVEKTIENVD